MQRDLILGLFALLLPSAALAQPAPSGLDGGYWTTGSGCNAVTFSGPTGPRTMMVDSNGNLCVTTAGGSSGPSAGLAPVVSGSLEASHVLKNAAGKIWSVYASNLTGGAAGFLVLLNLTAAPVDGAITPLACAPFSGGVAEINMNGMPPMAFSTGITAVVTSATTCFTKTTGVLTAYIAGMVQ